MDKRKIKRRIKILGIILVLLLLCKCGMDQLNKVDPGKEDPGVAVQTAEQELLQEMKEDESGLVALFERGDICSEGWIEEFQALAKKLQNYHYIKEDQAIKELVVRYKDYGSQLEGIAKRLSEEEYEAGLAELELTESVARQLEGELNELYEKHN